MYIYQYMPLILFIRLAFLIIIACMSCSSSKFGTNKSKVRVEKMVDHKPQYAIINNQIIIFENNY